VSWRRQRGVIGGVKPLTPLKAEGKVKRGLNPEVQGGGVKD
jgi:hypothetical protein